MKVIFLILGFLVLMSFFNIQNIANRNETITVAGFSITINFMTEAMVLVAAICAITVIAGLRILDTGLADPSIVILFKAMAFLSPFIFLMFINHDFFNVTLSNFYGAVFEAFITLLYLGAIGADLYSSGD